MHKKRFRAVGEQHLPSGISSFEEETVTILIIKIDINLCYKFLLAPLETAPGISERKGRNLSTIFT